MAFHVTQCPGCDSTFNTSARIIESAAGKVRCGACLTVFRADECFVDNGLGLDEDGEYLAESVFVSSPSDYFDPSSFFSRHALGGDTEAANEAHPPQDDATASPPLTGVAERDEATGPTPVAPDDAPDPQTEADITALFNDGGARDADDGDVLDGLAYSLSFAADESVPLQGAESPPHTQQDVPLTAFATPDDTAEERTTTTDENAHAPHDDTQDASEEINEDSEEIIRPVVGDSNTPSFVAPDDEADTSTLVTDTPTAQVEVNTESSARESRSWIDGDTDRPVDIDDFVDEEGESTEAIRARALKASLADEEALEAIPEESLSVLGRLSTPLELLSGGDRRLGRSLLWFGAALLLAALFTLQYFWQYRAVYSEMERFRPAYSWACERLDCELAPFHNIDAIRSDNLVVRQHPEMENALAVTISIRNTAAFPQEFPIMILSFNSADNTMIALREFAPEEYLPTGLQQVEMMPVMSPVQIELELIDPGPDAVNYTLAFRRP